MKKCLLLLKRNIHLLKKGELLRPSIFKFFFESLVLLSEANRTCFTDYGNLHLSRISHFILNLLGDFT